MPWLERNTLIHALEQCSPTKYLTYSEYVAHSSTSSSIRCTSASPSRSSRSREIRSWYSASVTLLTPSAAWKSMMAKLLI